MELDMNADLINLVNSLPWHHQIDLGDGILTPGNSKLEVLQAQADIYFRNDLVKNKSFLDIGCWDGFNSFEASKRGASSVLATDYFAWSNQCWGKKESFDLARSRLSPPGLDVRVIDLPDLTIENIGTWDIVLFAGVFYHLRHPFFVLENISKLVNETIIIETHLDAVELDRPAMIFYPTNELAMDHTNWWGPNPKAIIAMLKDLGFSQITFTDHPFYPNTRGIFHASKS